MSVPGFSYCATRTQCNPRQLKPTYWAYNPRSQTGTDTTVWEDDKSDATLTEFLVAEHNSNDDWHTLDRYHNDPPGEDRVDPAALEDFVQKTVRRMVQVPGRVFRLKMVS